MPKKTILGPIFVNCDRAGGFFFGKLFRVASHARYPSSGSGENSIPLWKGGGATKKGQRGQRRNYEL